MGKIGLPYLDSNCAEVLHHCVSILDNKHEKVDGVWPRYFRDDYASK